MTVLPAVSVTVRSTGNVKSSLRISHANTLAGIRATAPNSVPKPNRSGVAIKQIVFVERTAVLQIRHLLPGLPDDSCRGR